MTIPCPVCRRPFTPTHGRRYCQQSCTSVAQAWAEKARRAADSVDGYRQLRKEMGL